MVYEYEHRIQGIIWSNEDYWCIDNDKESNELREVYAKAKAWQKLKEELLTEYPYLVKGWNSTNGEGEHAEMCKANEILRRMDELDGTHEFSNLLDDMNMEDK